MRTSNLLQKTAVITFATLAEWLLLTKCTSATANKDNIIEDGYKTCKLIKAAEIKAAIVKSKSKKVILNVYPVKLSSNPAKKDFDFKIAYQDAIDYGKGINNKIDDKLFEMQSGWYVNFLKTKSVPRNKIPFGYFIHLDSSFLKNNVGISVCLVPGKENMNYFLLSEKSSGGTTKKDSTCKCPPDCCKYYILASDSTGKCPPECGGFLIYHTTIESIIEKKYGNK
jgi:hypothetical protein